MNLALAFAVLVVVVGCGSKTALDETPPRDAGPDVMSPITVDCGREDRYSSPGRIVSVDGTTTAPAGIASERWSLVTTPPGSTSTLFPDLGPTTTLTPDTVGDFRLRFEARDNEGREASCELTVHSVTGPPIAICPEQELQHTPVGVPIELVGDGYDDVVVASYAWELLEAPPGSMPTVAPSDAPVTTFVSATPGVYALQLTVTDNEGEQGKCECRVRVTTPPIVQCPADVIVAPTRRPVAIHADAMDDSAIVAVRWEVTTRPARSSAEPVPIDRNDTSLTPDRAGDYVLLFTATDDDGITASCEVRVMATPTGPDAICPGPIDTRPLTPTTITGSGVDDGDIVGFSWSLETIPDGSAADAPSPLDRATTIFTPDVVGEYALRLTVTDDMGLRDDCLVEVRAIPSEGLRVEIFWNGPPDRSCGEHPGAGCDPTDVDLHLLRPSATWFDDAGDCYWANCNSNAGSNLEWGARGDADNPRLDIDDIDGFGPENINIDVPVPGTYRVGVDFWQPDTLPTAEVTVNIYCGAESLTPDATFGPTVLRAVGTQLSYDFWRVADIEIGAGRCEVRDLASGGRPNIIRHGDARSMR